MAGLVLSAISAFPLETELRWVLSVLHSGPFGTVAQSSGLLPWLQHVHEALRGTIARYPFLAYGTDWLAFAHLVIAVVFIGPFRDPVRNKWIVTFGLVACAGVIPLALIAGHIRGIPIAWQVVDCSFGFFGALPLLICRRSICALEDR
jgi:hypothetical protein